MTTSNPEVQANHYLDQEAQAPGHSSDDHSHPRAQGEYEGKDAPTGPSSPNGITDEKPQGSETDTESYHEVERNIGVTKIEALYIVFGKGWKLAMLWL